MDKMQFERIYKTHCQELVWHANRLVNDRIIAEEITSDSFIKLWGLRNEIKNENQIGSILFTHATQAAKQHISNKQIEIQRLQEYLEPIATSFGLEGELLNENDIKELYAKINTLPPKHKIVVELSLKGLTIVEIAHRMAVSKNIVYSLKSNAINILRKALSKKSKETLNDPNSTNSTISAIQQISIKEDEINATLISHLAKHPHKLYDLDPYKFEKLVVALMKDMGYEVQHTIQTRDGGRDIIAVIKIPPNDEIVIIVQCKRHRADRPIGVDIVRSFLYTIREQDRANAGWIVTTSSFSRDARNLQQQYKWQLSLKDNNHLTDWCSNFGQWKQSDSGGLWLPNNPLA